MYWVDAQTGEIANRRFGREEMIGFLVRRPAGRVALEACGSGHWWARKIKALGHEVVLLHAKFIRPFVQTTKTDAADALVLLGRMEKTCPACGASIYLSNLSVHGRRKGDPLGCPRCHTKLVPVFNGPGRWLLVGGLVIIFAVALLQDIGNASPYTVPMLLLGFAMLICDFRWAFQ